MRRGITQRLRRLRAALSGRVDPLILMYHRVEDLTCDPWRLAVTPAHFAEQVELLARSRTIVPLDWLVGELAAGRIPDRAVAITFDDGYVDVLRNARPVLERFGAPATAYLTTGAIGRRREFWWDAVTRILLEPTELPSSLALEIGGVRRVFETSDRDAAHVAVWSALRPLASAARETALATLERAVPGIPPARDRDRALDPAEVRALAAGGLVAIGAHTVSHPSLPTLEPAERRREMRESRESCEALVGGPVGAFAYPFGDHDRVTVALAEECGFRHACTVEAGVATSARARYRLPRILVDDWSAAELERELAAST